MNLFGKRQPTVGTQRDPNPLTIRLRHIDIELAKLAKQRPRTENVWAAIDFWLGKRWQLKHGREGGVR